MIVSAPTVAPMRVRLVFAEALGQELLRRRGFSSCWFLVPLEAAVVGDLVYEIASAFDLHRCCPGGLELALDGAHILPTLPVAVIRDHDALVVQCATFRTPTATEEGMATARLKRRRDKQEAEKERKSSKKLRGAVTVSPSPKTKGKRANKSFPVALSVDSSSSSSSSSSSDEDESSSSSDEEAPTTSKRVTESKTKSKKLLQSAIKEAKAAARHPAKVQDVNSSSSSSSSDSSDDSDSSSSSDDDSSDDGGNASGTKAKATAPTTNETKSAPSASTTNGTASARTRRRRRLRSRHRNNSNNARVDDEGKASNKAPTVPRPSTTAAPTETTSAPPPPEAPREIRPLRIRGRPTRGPTASTMHVRFDGNGGSTNDDSRTGDVASQVGDRDGQQSKYGTPLTGRNGHHDRHERPGRGEPQRQRAYRENDEEGPPPPSTRSKGKKPVDMWKRPYEVLSSIHDQPATTSTSTNGTTAQDLETLLAAYPTQTAEATAAVGGLHADDVVAYKTLTLCLETWQPLVSDWQCGKITAVQGADGTATVEKLALSVIARDGNEGNMLKWSPAHGPADESTGVVTLSEISELRFLAGPSFDKLSGATTATTVT